MKQTNIRIRMSLQERSTVRKMAKRRGTTMSELVRGLLKKEARKGAKA